MGEVLEIIISAEILLMEDPATPSIVEKASIDDPTIPTSIAEMTSIKDSVTPIIAKVLSMVHLAIPTSIAKIHLAEDLAIPLRAATHSVDHPATFTSAETTSMGQWTTHTWMVPVGRRAFVPTSSRRRNQMTQSSVRINLSYISTPNRESCELLPNRYNNKIAVHYCIL